MYKPVYGISNDASNSGQFSYPLPNIVLPLDTKLRTVFVSATEHGSSAGVRIGIGTAREFVVSSVRIGAGMAREFDYA